MKSIVRRDTGESYREYLRRLAVESGVGPEDGDAVRQRDRKRKKTASNQDWMNPHDPEAEITKMKDGRTHLAYKAEQAVDLETGAIVAVTTHGGATGDTASVGKTLQAAGEAVAGQIATATSEGEYLVDAKGMQEVVTDKGYHSSTVLQQIRAMRIRTYISAPKQQRRNWEKRTAEKAAVYGNRKRISGERGKELLRRRGEFLERPFAHQYETGGMRRLHIRGVTNVAKRVLMQAAAYNLALILRAQGGAGAPKGLADLRDALICALLALIDAFRRLSGDQHPGIRRNERESAETRKIERIYSIK